MVKDNDIKEKLGKLLTTIFQFDTEDLDFGIYKILNYKKKEIAEFIKKDLIEEINKQLKLIGSEEQKKQQAELEKLKNQLIDLGIEDYESNPKYQEKKKQLKNIKVSQELEKQIYNYIYAFFSRYYDRGDFISKRRYGKNKKYAIPYNGEETLLHWASNDQYYVKTTESFKKFSFKITGLKVNFRVVEAEEDNGNVKAEESRYFIVSSEKVYDLEKNELNVYFEFRALTNTEKKKYPKPNQEQINEDNIKSIQKALEKESKTKELFKEDEKGKTQLSKNLNKYTRKNTSDYFIHKYLKSFLERELDFFIKNEVVDLSDVTQLDVEHFNTYVLEVKVLRNICNKIIDFLSQIEKFQIKLWEKKKFILKTGYIISIDRVPEEFHDEIIKNKEQVAEWKELFGIEVKTKKDLIANNTLNGVELKKLPVDTKHFSEIFKERLLTDLAKEEDIDNLIDGVLINSENFQSLTLILEKFRGKVKFIYIDPPYNTGNDEFLYKDHYQSSSWLSMMYDRLILARELLADDGIIYVSIDDNEAENLAKLMKYIFSEIPVNYYIQVRYEGKTLTEKSDYQKLIEQLMCGHKGEFKARKEEIEYTTEKFEWEIIEKTKSPKKTKLGRRDVEIFQEGGYEIKKVKPFINCLKETWASGSVLKGNASGKFFNDFIFPRKSIDGLKVLYKVYGIGEDGLGYRYFTGPKREDATKGKFYSGIPLTKRKQIEKEGRATKKKIIPNFYNFADSFGNCRHEGGVELRSGKKPEKFLEQFIKISTGNNQLVLDFFAGTGGTLAVAHKMGRKSIGVELSNDFFHNKLKKRILNVINGDKTGISENYGWKGGGFFKYHYLEQYEDALENIEFSQKKLSEFSDYFVKYMLDFETRDSVTFLNIDKMENPFDYKLYVLEDYQQKAVSVDLVETYNYLIGLEVSKFKTFQNKDDDNRKYVVIEGKRENRPVIVIWRNITKFNPEKDRDFIQKNILKEKFDEAHINGDNLIKDSVLIEEQFKRLMNAKSNLRD